MYVVVMHPLMCPNMYIMAVAAASGQRRRAVSTE